MWHSNKVSQKKQFEYRLEMIPFKTEPAREQQLLAVLNKLGQDGWHVCNLDVAAHLDRVENGIKVLLIRAVYKPVYENLALMGYDDDFDDDDFADDDFADD